MMEICLCDDVERVNFTDFIPYVAVNVDGVPNNVIGHMVRLSAIEFARRTQSIKRTVWLDLQECVTDYVLRLEDCYSLLAVNKVCCGDQELHAERDMSCCTYGGAWYAFEKPDRLFIGLSPEEDQVRGLELRITVQPGQDSCAVDRCVYDTHAEAIAAGALHRIFLMKGEEWHDPALAMVHAREFSAAVSDARMRDRAGYSTDPTVMRMPGGFFV